MTVNIRRMTAADKPSIMKMLRATPEFQPFEVTIAEELIDAYLQDSVASGYHILVADIDHSAVGYVCYGPTPLTEGTWDVYWEAVSADKQGQGIGSALLRTAGRNIEQTKGRLILIETSSQPLYEKTRQFYLGQGYTEICRIPDFYAPGDDKVVYQRRLKS